MNIVRELKISEIVDIELSEKAKNFSDIFAKIMNSLTWYITSNKDFVYGMRPSYIERFEEPFFIKYDILNKKLLCSNIFEYNIFWQDYEKVIEYQLYNYFTNGKFEYEIIDNNEHLIYGKTLGYQINEPKFLEIETIYHISPILGG